MASRAEQFRSRRERTRAREHTEEKKPGKTETPLQRLMAKLNRAFQGPRALAALRDFYSGTSQPPPVLPEPDPHQPPPAPRRRLSKKEADAHIKEATPLKAKQLLKTTSPTDRHNKRGNS